jgi:hypothetical protein
MCFIQRGVDAADAPAAEKASAVPITAVATKTRMPRFTGSPFSRALPAFGDGILSTDLQTGQMG